MKFIGPIALVVAVMTLLAVTAGASIRRRDGQDLSWTDGLVLFGLYVTIVLTICAIVDALVALVRVWRT